MSSGLPSPKERSAIVSRLKTAVGHLRAVIEMVEAGEPCDFVLHQLGAVQAALVAAGGAIIDCQVESSAEIILCNPSTEARVAELERLVTLYGLLTKHSVLLLEAPNDRTSQKRARTAH